MLYVRRITRIYGATFQYRRSSKRSLRIGRMCTSTPHLILYIFSITTVVSVEMHLPQLSNYYHVNHEYFCQAT